MTLQFALLIIASGAVLALAVNKWHEFACADLERLRQQEHWVGRFTRGARILMNDERVPREALETLATLNRFLLRRDACTVLLQMFTQPGGMSRSTDRSAEELEFFEMHPELARAISETSFAALMAMTYTDLRLGDRARGAMARLYRGEAQVTELATAAVREVTRNDHPLPPGLIAA